MYKLELTVISINKDGKQRSYSYDVTAEYLTLGKDKNITNAENDYINEELAEFIQCEFDIKVELQEFTATLYKDDEQVAEMKTKLTNNWN